MLKKNIEAEINSRLNRGTTCRLNNSNTNILKAFGVFLIDHLFYTIIDTGSRKKVLKCNFTDTILY